MLVYELVLKRNLPAADVQRIQAMMQAVVPEPAPPVLLPLSAPNSAKLAAGARVRRSRSRSPRHKESTRHYYRVNERGGKVSSTRYATQRGQGPMHVVTGILTRILRRQMYKYPARYRGIRAPVSVRAAVTSAVRNEWLTPRQAQAYLDQYEVDKAHVDENKATVFIQQAGTSAIRQYEGCYHMITHPSRANLVNGDTKRVVVNYVQSKKNRR